jgi:2-hydroxymuconate-semialdehyde hydrolase
MSYVRRTFFVDNIPVAWWEGGAGTAVLLIHGSGPGASTMANWGALLGALATRVHVHAMDLIGFGESGRKPVSPYFDLDLWLRQCRALINRMPGDEIGVIGHSLSGALGLKLAAVEPRVRKVLTTASMGAKFALNPDLARGWTFPCSREELRRIAEVLVCDKSLITDDFLARREEVIWKDAAYAAYFNAMFSGDKQRYIGEMTLSPDELAGITSAVTMMHGRDDTVIPPSVTLQMAEHIPQANVFLLSRCSHSIALERSPMFISAVDQLYGHATGPATGGRE